MKPCLTTSMPLNHQPVETWQSFEMLWGRTSNWDPFTFGYLYIVIVSLSIFIAPNKNTIFLTISALIAFFGSWIVFSNVNVIHDYYQLPVAVIIALSFAVSFSRIVDWVISKLDRKMIPLAPSMIIFAIIPFSLFVVITQDSLSDKARSTIWNSIEYALRDEQIFLHVSNQRKVVPTVGGLVGTKFVRITPEEFESDCERYLGQYSAVLSDGQSDCIQSTRSSATFYIEDGNSIFYMNVNRYLESRIDLVSASAPVIDAAYGVYLEGKELIYLKRACDKKDMDTRFFLHVFPTSRSSLPGDKNNEFQNLDFRFEEKGTKVDEQCVAVRELPDYPIAQIVTGQYVPGQGRTWEGTYQFAK